MSKRAVVLSVCLAACGGDDGSKMVDARVNTGPEYNLSCLDYVPPSVDNPINIALTVFDMGTLPMAPTLPNVEVKAYDTDGTTVITMGTTDDMGVVNLSIPTNGTTPAKGDVGAAPAGFPVQRGAVTAGGTKSGPDNFPIYPQVFVDGLYTALGATADSSKGTLVVILADCSGNNMPSVTPSLAEAPDATWAMYGGIGAWLVRTSTVNHPMYMAGSVAGTTNVEPGMHTVKLKTLARDLTPITVRVHAGELSVLYYFPGVWQRP